MKIGTLFVSVIFAIAFSMNANAKSQVVFNEPVVDLVSVIKKIQNNDDKSQFVDVRRGGRGGSFGRSRSRSSSNTRSRSNSRTKSSQPALKNNPQKAPSFGGKRITSQQAKARYGVPRKQQTVQSRSQDGSNVTYRMNNYGGFSSGLMTGYMMGSMPWYMTSAAFFYSRPVYATNDDGTVDVYPPSFNWGRLFLILLIVGAVVLIVRSAIRSRKQGAAREYAQSSFR